MDQHPIKSDEVQRALMFPKDDFRRLLVNILDINDRGDSILEPPDILILGIAVAMLRHLPFTPDGLQPMLRRLHKDWKTPANELDRIWEENDHDTPVADFHLGIADWEYVTWVGLDEFFHPKTCEYLPHLPRPAAFAVTIHVAAIYFRFKEALEEQRHKNADTTAGVSQSVVE